MDRMTRLWSPEYQIAARTELAKADAMRVKPAQYKGRRRKGLPTEAILFWSLIAVAIAFAGAIVAFL